MNPKYSHALQHDCNKNNGQVSSFIKITLCLRMTRIQRNTLIILEIAKIIVQTRVGGLPSTSKHRDELKLRVEGKHF